MNNIGIGTGIGALGGGAIGYMLGGGWMAAVGAVAGALGGTLIASNTRNSGGDAQPGVGGGEEPAGKQLSQQLAQAMGMGQPQGLVPSYTPTTTPTGAEVNLPAV